jgi:hypothetical protein
MENPNMAYGVDGSNNVSVNTFTYQAVPTQQQPPPQQQQAPPIDTQLQGQQPAPPVAMQALAGMAANSAYQILTQQQQQAQVSPSTTQQQQQAAVSLPPPTQHSDYSCATPEGMRVCHNLGF